MALHVPHEKLNGLHALWLEKAGGRIMPSRGDFLPEELKAWLPNIALYDVEREPLRLKARLVGSRIVEYDGHEGTGRYLDEIITPRFYADIFASYRFCIERREPVYSAIERTSAEGHKRGFASLRAPLSSDGETVTMVLAGVYAYAPDMHRKGAQSFEEFMEMGPVED
jgi:hypothetical protein